MLQNRDYTLIVDKSGSMAEKDAVGGMSRWAAAKESTLALAAKICEFDPDGITVYTFAGSYKKYENVTESKVAQVWQENEPNGSTDLAAVLQDALDDYFSRKKAGKTKENGDLIIVVTDGVPNDQKRPAKIIVEATKKLDKDEELAILFLQIGKDKSATDYLKSLDDDLTAQGAKFDIVDTTTADEAENMTFSELLLKAIND